MSRGTFEEVKIMARIIKTIEIEEAPANSGNSGQTNRKTKSKVREANRKPKASGNEGNSLS